MKASDLQVGDVVHCESARYAVTSVRPHTEDMLIQGLWPRTGTAIADFLDVDYDLRQPSTTITRNNVQIHPPTDAGGEGV